MNFQCPSCKTTLSAGEHQAGQLVRCPTCLGTLRVPVPVAAVAQGVEELPLAPSRSPSSEPSGAPPSAPPPPSRSSVATMAVPRVAGRKYGFPCPYCSSRLEASESQGGTEGNCPTCDQAITIPILDRFGRLIDPRTNQILKPDPHPVHAYAAAGRNAPRIVRRHDGSQQIVCPRCQSSSPITVNNCRNCGAPFTLEGTAPDLNIEGNGYATASLVLGIISIPGACIGVAGPLSLILGGVALYQARDTTGGKGTAYAGMVCGGIGSLISFYFFFFR